MQFIHRSRPLGAAALGATGLGAAAVMLAVAFPTVARGAVAAVTSVSCSVTSSNWCIGGNNSSSGIGVIGTSKSGTGLRGTSTSQYGLKATSSSGSAILAQTTSGAAAIIANGSSNGYGVDATGGREGLFGRATATKDGVGVSGLALSSDGAGVLGQNAGKGIGGEFYSSLGTGVFATGTNVGIYGQTGSRGLPLELTDGINVLFEVDGHGNVAYKGELQSLARTAGGGTARSFAAVSTAPTVEDTGTAQLVRGTAVVRLDPTFAALIEPAAGYRVFVTPDGETHELFVAGKTAAGFVVREAQAGRSTVAFDYRIVATKLGAAGKHMAMLSSAEARTFTMHDRLPANPAVKLPAADDAATP